MAGVLTANLVLQKTKLDHLKHVRKLNVCGVHVSDIRVLREAKNVEVLSLSVNEIEDLEPLSACQNLRELYLRKNSVSDVHQVLHLTRLPYLSCLTLSDNPIAADPNYRRFCVAALPCLVRFDDFDVSPAERAEALHWFPDLASLPPPNPLQPASAAADHGRPSTAAAASTAATPRRNRLSLEMPLDEPAHGAAAGNSAGRRSTAAAAPASTGAHDVSRANLARKFHELSTAFDDLPVGGGARGGAGGAHKHAISSAAPRTPSGSPADDEPGHAVSRHPAASRVAAPAGPREDGVVAAVKLLLDEMSPAGLLEIRKYLDHRLR